MNIIIYYCFYVTASINFIATRSFTALRTPPLQSHTNFHRKLSQPNCLMTQSFFISSGQDIILNIVSNCLDKERVRPCMYGVLLVDYFFTAIQKLYFYVESRPSTHNDSWDAKPISLNDVESTLNFWTSYSPQKQNICIPVMLYKYRMMMTFSIWSIK